MNRAFSPLNGRGSSLRFRLAWLTLYGIAFGYLEATVVVYLREIFYPQGFSFPITIPQGSLYPIELVRETATLIMLLAPAMLGAFTGWGRFGAFALLFGVWDLAFYGSLQAAVGWPGNLMTWDLLFLVPRIWVGPVLSAAAVALSLVVAGVILIEREARARAPRGDWWLWLGAAGSLGLLLWSFMINDPVVARGEMPQGFPWGLYGVGFILGWVVFALSWRGGGRRVVMPEDGGVPRQGGLSDTRF